MVAALKEYEDIYNVKITFSVETEPLGTAGPLALARDILNKDDSPFFVLNSDVICDYPFESLRDFHLSHGGEGTITVSLFSFSSLSNLIHQILGDQSGRSFKIWCCCE
jgi:mannose-1-phosphate guanylyltransferase